MQEAQRSGAELLPVDSEHSAVFQCLPPHFAPGLEAVGVERIVLTASGGPFRETPAESLHAVTPEQACAHPNWSMGRKISVDSATMMNKGLEIIEACCLFGLSPDRVEVLLHPQSIVHAMVQYNDGSVLAQMGNPDMRTPIAHALAWPQRLHSGVGPLELARAGRLDFAAVDPARFPCLDLAYQALRAGGTSTAILNAANEVAVQAFLDRRIRFTDIPRVIEETLGVVPRTDASSLDQILADDSAARVVAAQRAALRTAVAPC
jgi:1-deoxy-D-xylulose-5-phosphate reductoisomerase